MGEPLMELRRRVYRRSIIKDIGVIAAIDVLLKAIRNAEEGQELERLHAVIEVHRKHRLRLQPPGGSPSRSDMHR
jgi:hypothetical protein